MTKHFINKPINTLLLVLIFLTSCNGQAKTNSQVDNKPKTLLDGQPKLTRTQGSNEYQSIGCGLQDRYGNLWFGTTGEGVYRYDGKLFTQFTVKDGLSNNSVWSILEDKSSNIWFGTTDGICRYDGKQITTFPISDYIRPIINNNDYYSDWCKKTTVWSMLQDKSGKIWFGTGDGVYFYDGMTFTRLLANYNIINKDNLHLKMIACMLEDKNGDIWFGSGMPPGMEGLCRYDGKSIVRYKPNNENWIRKMIVSKNGNLMLATRRNGIMNYDGKSFTNYTQPKDLYKESIRTIMEDKAGNLWVASEYGKDMGDTLGGAWRSNISTANQTEKTFTKITNKEVFFMLEDKDNKIWLGTRGMGLYRYDGKTLTKFSE